jgi:hypothetical protein
MSFKESLPGWRLTLTGCRKGRKVHHFATIRPAPAAPATASSIVWWLVAVAVLALVVAGGVILSSRR